MEFLSVELLWVELLSVELLTLVVAPRTLSHRRGFVFVGLGKQNGMVMASAVVDTALPGQCHWAWAGP